MGWSPNKYKIGKLNLIEIDKNNRVLRKYF